MHSSSSIPSRIGEIKNIEELYLFNNNFRGTLPTQIGNLRNLTKLSFAYNALRGTIPLQVANLLKLDTFHLHQNQLLENVDLFNYSIQSFVSDCGNTQNTPSLTTCASCTECCNQNGAASTKREHGRGEIFLKIPNKENFLKLPTIVGHEPHV